ncbi:hypothetical protein VULLAG_LOCUS15381 [Vulpes lagopus]
MDTLRAGAAGEHTPTRMHEHVWARVYTGHPRALQRGRQTGGSRTGGPRGRRDVHPPGPRAAVRSGLQSPWRDLSPSSWPRMGSSQAPPALSPPESPVLGRGCGVWESPPRQQVPKRCWGNRVGRVSFRDGRLGGRARGQAGVSRPDGRWPTS